MTIEDTVQRHLPLGLFPPLRYAALRAVHRLDREIPFVTKMLRERRGTGIDVGANYGMYSMPLSTVCDRVMAFEPQPRCAAVLRAYARRFKRPITVYECALSNIEGTLPLRIPIRGGFLLSRHATGFASLREDVEGDAIMVSVRRLDDFEFTDVSIIKIDVEGGEPAVIAGALTTIERSRPILLVEIEQRHLRGSRLSDVFQNIEELGYNGKFVQSGKLTPISAFSYDQHQAPFEAEVERAGSHPRYINNFFFLPRTDRLNR